MRGQHLHSFWVHDEIDGKEGARRAKFRSDRKKGLGFMAKDERLTIEQLAARADELQDVIDEGEDLNGAVTEALRGK